MIPTAWLTNLSALLPRRIVIYRRLYRMQRTSDSMPATTHTFRILLIEDEPKLRESLADGLRLEDLHVTTAGSGMDALRWLGFEQFDLLILDWMLPDVDGLELLREIRSRGMDVPVLVVTARSSHHDETLAVRSGATDFMMKPFGFADLLARCRRLLALS
jgi:DNA-binding response OmpR family regulator